MRIKTAQVGTEGGWKSERKLLGAFVSIWKWPVLKPSCWEHYVSWEGKRSKSNRPDIFHGWREDIQSQVSITAAGLPGDLPALHHNWETPEEFYRHRTQEPQSFVWEMSWYFFTPLHHWTKGQLIPCLNTNWFYSNISEEVTEGKLELFSWFSECS